MKVLICYESGAGGESIATERIIQELEKSTLHKVIAVNTPSLTRSDSLHFFWWIIKSIFNWLLVISNTRKVNWIYTTTYTAGFAAALLKPLSRYKQAWHFHGDRMPPNAQGLIGKTYITQTLKYHTVRLAHQLFLKFTDIIFVPSSESKRQLILQFPLTAKKQIVIIPNGVDHKRFWPAHGKRLQARVKLGIEPSKKVLLFVGRIDPKKGIEELIEVFSYLYKRQRNYLLLVAYPKIRNQSDAVYLQLLIKKAMKKSIYIAIKWYENYFDLASLYHVADIAISLSVQENFPLTLLESWAAGTLYACRPVGEAAYLVRSIDPRLLLAESSLKGIAQKIKLLLNVNAKPKQVLIYKQQQRVKKYTWENAGNLITDQLMNFQSK